MHSVSEAGLETSLREAFLAQSGMVWLEQGGPSGESAAWIRVSEDSGDESRVATADGCGVCGGEVRPHVHFLGTGIGCCENCQCGMVIKLPPEAKPICHDDYSDRYENELQENKSKSCWDLLLGRTRGLAGVGRILDIGCGRGEFLDLARQAGLETAGVEISLNAAMTTVMKGHGVLCGSATDCRVPAGEAFDVVTMWDVLEHLERPGDALRNASSALAPGGRLFIATPMMGSVYDRAGVMLSRLTGGRSNPLLRMCWSHDHLYRFDPTGLCQALRTMGFDRVTATRIQLLSLEADRYAGSDLLPRWTPSSHLNRWISLAGVRASRVLRLHNKILIEARRSES